MGCSESTHNADHRINKEEIDQLRDFKSLTTKAIEEYFNLLQSILLSTQVLTNKLTKISGESQIIVSALNLKHQTLIEQASQGLQEQLSKIKEFTFLLDEYQQENLRIIEKPNFNLSEQFELPKELFGEDHPNIEKVSYYENSETLESLLRKLDQQEETISLSFGVSQKLSVRHSRQVDNYKKLSNSDDSLSNLIVQH